jgi:hypothetical protein
MESVPVALRKEVLSLKIQTLTQLMPGLTVKPVMQSSVNPSALHSHSARHSVPHKHNAFLML